MTREEFLNIDWSDSHIRYDMQVTNNESIRYRTVAYVTMSKEVPNCLCLVTGSNKFPVRNTGCGISKNPMPIDILRLLRERSDIFNQKVVAVVDDIIYDLKPGVMHINGIDLEVLFELIPYEPVVASETESNY